MNKIIYSEAVDKKWQKKWEETDVYHFDECKMANKHYLLEMFSYPSGKNLHIGHWWNYSLSDSYGRLKRMQGYEVFHPPGFDAFGLPAENYAIKAGVHPEDSTRVNIATMESQFRTMGTTYDWNYEIVTCNPEYYKWTQWLFLKLFEKKLAYRKEAPVNWCPSCMTVLANEQVINGHCERCESQVTHKNMTQWFYRITDYAEELLGGLDTLDWPKKTKMIQQNWIGKSDGCEVDFIAGDKTITVYTTRVDTVMGVTYIVLAPEHPFIGQLTDPIYKAAADDYREKAANLSDIERMSVGKEKTGVFTGICALHPITKKEIPVWVSDYVLISYGTGAVMAVPAHDERDFEFASKYGLPAAPVIQSQPFSASLPFCEDGVLINSGVYNGLSSERARERIAVDLEKIGFGRKAVKYRLRDWLVSRQRYWGAPIPIIFCQSCGMVPVPEADLPVRLPYDVEFMPSGQSPLSLCDDFTNTTCPACGKPAKRDTDTLDTFVCSSWYFLRFFDNKNTKEAFDMQRVNAIMPVDKYVGGIEHASMHLLYARFMTMALHDMGYLNFKEPFLSLVHQGIILGDDGKKMSKRSGAVSPGAYIRQYGTDVFRLYLGFGFSFLDGGQWSDDGIKAAARFTRKICRVVDKHLELPPSKADSGKAMHNELEYVRHYTIAQVTKDYNDFQFNTSIARIMEYVNAIMKYQANNDNMRNYNHERDIIKDLILLLAPMAPHLSEELWEQMGYEYSVHNQAWPVCDKTMLVQDTVKIAVQLNGKLRDVITVSPSIEGDALKDLVLTRSKISTLIAGREIKQAIIVKGKLVNIVC
jgi:leucyl-tRNA synthetase